MHESTWYLLARKDSSGLVWRLTDVSATFAPPTKEQPCDTWLSASPRSC